MVDEKYNKSEPLNFSSYPFSQIPNGNYTEDSFTKIVLEGKQITKQLSIGGQEIGTTDKGQSKFKFIAPNEILSQVGHEWSEYQGFALNALKGINNFNKRLKGSVSMLSKTLKKSDDFAQKGLGEIRKAYADGKLSLGLDEEGQQKFKNSLSSVDTFTDWISNALTVQNASNIIGGIFNISESLSSELYSAFSTISPEIPFSKVDAAVTYRNTQHRDFTFTFELVYSDRNSVAQQVYYPINRLMEMSCAERDINNLRIKPPYIFKVYTEPFAFIRMRNAALISVQTNWKYPYINGIPSQAEVTLSFKEIDPVYRKTFNEKGEYINVSSKGNNTSNNSPLNNRFSGPDNTMGTVTYARLL